MASIVKHSFDGQAHRFPEGTSQEVIDKVIKNYTINARGGLQAIEDEARQSLAAEEEASAKEASYQQALQSGIPLSPADEQRRLAERREVESKFAGPSVVDQAVSLLPSAFGMTGGAVGLATGGPVRAVAGATAGNLFGETLERAITGQEATSDMLVQAGFEGLTEALAGPLTKLIKAGVPITANLLRQYGISPTDAVGVAKVFQKPSNTNALGVARVGTETSKRETQELLNEGQRIVNESMETVDEQIATGLLPSQVSNTPFRRIAEAFGRASSDGKQAFENITEANGKAIGALVQRVVYGNRGAVTTEQMGRQYYDIVKEANTALGQTYRDQQDRLLASAGDLRLSTSGIKADVKAVKDELLAPYQTQATTRVDPQTGIVEKVPASQTPEGLFGAELKSMFSKAQTLKEGVTFSEANAFIRDVTALADKATKELGSSSPQAVMLNQLKNKSIKQFEGTMPPNILSDWRKMRASYGASKKALFPKALSAIMKKGGKEDFAAIGNMLATSPNSSQITMAFKALEEAKRINPSLDTFAATRDIRNGWLETAMKSGEGTLTNYAGLYDKLLKDKKFRESYNAVMGEGGAPLTKILRAAKQANEKTKQGAVLSLFVASGQIAGATDVLKGIGALAATGGAYAGSPSLMISGAAVVVLPAVAAKVASNPKLANKLLGIEKRSYTAPAYVTASSVLRLLREANVDMEAVNEYLASTGLPILTEESINNNKDTKR